MDFNNIFPVLEMRITFMKLNANGYSLRNMNSGYIQIYYLDFKKHFPVFCLIFTFWNFKNIFFLDFMNIFPEFFKFYSWKYQHY